jgi:hypothetical protein
MRLRTIRVGALLLVAGAVLPACAFAETSTFAHGTMEQKLTSTVPGTPTGFHFIGTYHAAGDASKPPPYMRKMTFYDPTGRRFDTSVPERCTASDIELAARGAAACPEGSRVGGGTTDVLFMGSFPSTAAIDVFNNADEQIMLAQSPVVTSVARGRMQPDGSIEYASPTCYPATARRTTCSR